MKPIGNTYLIKCKPVDNVTNEGGIFVVNDVDKVKDGFWKGTIIAYGTLMSDDDEDLIPIGTEVVVDVTKKAAMKLVLGKGVYYIRNKDEIIGVIEDE